MIDKSNVYKICKDRNGSFSFEKVNALVQRLFPETKSGQLTKEHVKELLSHLDNNKNEITDEGWLKKKHSEGNLKLTKLSGATDSSQHSIEDEELIQYVNRINSLILEDKLLRGRHPIRIENFFQECGDGIILR
jgi:hypothetical protein